APPHSASTLAAASRALVFLGLGSFGALFPLVLAGAAGSGGASAGIAASDWAGAGAGDSAAGASGAGGSAASSGVSAGTVAGGCSGSGAGGWAWTSAGLAPFLGLAALVGCLGDFGLAMVGSPRCG